MSEKRNNIRRNRNLTSGSMALNTRSSALPKRRYFPDEQREIVKKPRQVKKKYAKMKYAPSIDLVAFIGFMAVVALFVFVCTEYVKVYDKVKQTESATRAIVQETESLKAANDNTENNIYNNIDLEKIRKLAIEKYGMVYPYENQVITYRSVTNGYVRQYGDLKGNEAPNLIERILRVVNAG